MAPRRHAGVQRGWLMVIALAVFACEVDEGERFDRVIHLQPEPRAGVEWEEAALVQIGAESRRAWRVQSGHSIELRALVPEAGRLELSVALAPGDLPPPHDVSAVISLRENARESRVLMRQPLRPIREWQPLALGLAEQAGRNIVIEFRFEVPDGADPVVGLLGEIVLLGRHDGPRLPNVVLVTLDTTRADVAYDPEVSPHLAMLSARGITFQRAWSAATTTSAAHASILTGLPVERHGTASNHSKLGEDQITLAEVLRDLGYQTAGSVSVRHLGPEVGFGQGFDRFRPAAPGDAADGRRALDPALDWLSSWQLNGSRPFFLWLHVFDPHTPYGPPARFLQGEWAERGRLVPSSNADPPTFPVFPGGPPVPLDWLAGVTSREYVSALYRAGVGYADHLLGRLLANLDKSGESDRTIIVVTSDHGEALGEQDVWYQHAGLFPASLRVPLVIALPKGPRGVRSSARVSTLDIVPTVLRAVTGTPASMPGRDLLGSLAEPDASRRVWFAEAGLDQLGFRDGEVLFAHALRPGQVGVRVDRRDGVPRVVGIRSYRPGASWLFDVNADPELSRNLASDSGAGVSRYRELVQSRAAGSAARMQRRTLSADDQSRLRALGYVGETP